MNISKIIDYLRGLQLQIGDATEIDLQDGQAPAWIHLLPPSGFTGRDARGPFYYNAQTLIDGFIANKADLPIDTDHQSLNAREKVGPAGMSYGWIKELAFDLSKGLMARVEWTKDGEALVANKAYRYTSPVFFADSETGEINRIVGSSLVPYPNLVLDALTHSEELKSSVENLFIDNKGEIEMNLNELAQLLGITCSDEAPATKEQVLDAFANMQTKLKEMTSELGELKASQADASVQLEANSQLVAGKDTELQAMALQLETANQSLQAMTQKLAETDSELTALRAEQAEKALDAKIQALVANGKLLPGVVEHARKIAQTAGIESLEALVANQDFSHLQKPVANGFDDKSGAQGEFSKLFLGLAGIKNS